MCVELTVMTMVALDSVLTTARKTTARMTTKATITTATINATWLFSAGGGAIAGFQVCVD
jgi:hypothetical protein